MAGGGGRRRRGRHGRRDRRGRRGTQTGQRIKSHPREIVRMPCPLPAVRRRQQGHDRIRRRHLCRGRP
eukprot:3942242-Prymnesium_polylepis.1